MFTIYQLWYCVFYSSGRAAIFKGPSPRQDGDPFRLHFEGNGGELKKVKSFLWPYPPSLVATNNNQPLMKYDQPLMNNDQPAMNYDQPAMIYDQSAVNYDDIVINCDQPSASKHIKESPQQVTSSAKVLKPILYTNKKQLNQASLNEQLSKSTVIIQSNQSISNPPPD